MEELRAVLIAVGVTVVAVIAGWELYRRRPGVGGRSAAVLVTEALGRLASGLRNLARSRVSKREAKRRRGEPGLDAAGLVEDASDDPIRTIALGDLGALARAAATEVGRARTNGRGAGGGLPPAAPAASHPPSAASEVPAQERFLVVLTLMAPGGGRFEGPRLHEALSGFDLRLGTQGLFHHFGGHLGATGGAAPRPVFSVANVLEPGTFEAKSLSAFSTPGICLILQVPGPIDAIVAFELMVDVGRKLARTLGGELRDARRSSLTAQGVQRLRDEVLDHVRRLRARARPASPSRVLH